MGITDFPTVSRGTTQTQLTTMHHLAEENEALHEENEVLRTENAELKAKLARVWEFIEAHTATP